MSSFSTLRNSIEAGNTRVSLELLSSGKIFANSMDEHGITPLMIAARANQPQIVEALLKLKWHMTALFHAVQGASTQSVRSILKARANPNIRDEKGETAVVKAVRLQNIEMVNALIQHGADISGMCNEEDESETVSYHCRTPLMEATRLANVDMVSLLLVSKASVSISTKNEGWSAIFFGAMSGNCNVCKMLINSRADPTTVDNYGGNAFKWIRSPCKEEEKIFKLFQREVNWKMAREMFIGKKSDVSMLQHIDDHVLKQIVDLGFPR